MKNTIAIIAALASLNACSNGPSYVERKPDGTIKVITTYNGLFDKSSEDNHEAILPDGTRLAFRAKNRDNTKAAAIWGNLQTTKALAKPVTGALNNAVDAVTR